MMNPVPWLQMTNMISYQGLVRTFPRETNKNSIAYKSAIQTAQEWQARLEVMIKRADKINEAQPIAETIQKVKKSKKVKKEKNSVRVSDELLKLTDLRDGGLLTDDEFEDRISKLNS